MKNIVVGAILSLAASSGLAETELKSLENISRELVEIRQQIETLHNDISYEKEVYRDQMRSYSNQKSDLDVRISRADLNIKDLERELTRLADISKNKSQDQENIIPILKENIERIRVTVAGSLPFKLKQRLQALDEIEHRLDTHIITPNKAANQLWAFVEDELMLGRSSGLYNETLIIDGQDKLVKVLRIGKLAMFYKTQDDRFGLVRKEGDQWRQQAFDDATNTAKLEQLFDSFNKNVRNGQFSIPNFLPKS